MAQTILDKIKTYKFEEIAEQKKLVSPQEIQFRARHARPIRPFEQALWSASKSHFGLIAEIKQASPSKGLIRKNFDPTALAKAYAAGGATCLSVLTDRPSFGGSFDDMVDASLACNLPVLRKDFIFDPYQVIESRALSADCILIILAAVSDMQASELIELAIEWNMDVLVEVHDHWELDRALTLPITMIGINNRDLKTFATTLDITGELAPHIPSDYVVVAESGIKTYADLANLSEFGVRNFLVGESLMRQADVAAATASLLDNP
ncbi:MAG: indole-3-glycerol phosphate synthase TrpC [Aestuariivita sp.]|nr:indole-3-glycerol phosphate synthase TrpC [Aestuariivita sp.]MCY4202605.1 indole-3-glycerol phosphate synthase TrpC [Aestuariivita sp.]